MSEKIVKNLKKIMDERGMKQSFLKDKVGVSSTTMSSLYRGDSIPTMLVGLKIARELGVNIEEIWHLEPKIEVK